PKEDSDAAPIFSFMATGGQPDYWVNTATYGHMMQRLTDWDGRSGLLDTSAEPVDDDPDLRAASAEITMAKDLNDAFEPIEPTDTYDPDESFHASIEVANVPNGIHISNRWYFGSVLLREAGTTTRQDVSRQLLASVLTSPEEGWEPGDYRLEVYFADELMDTAEFSVE
ncbi:MAG TPA: hypothetical protein VER55_13225, partial [Ardenticatenaceae bacterium]|nr:hypothetical protein [Ardenticatenaceae bacterium]